MKKIYCAIIIAGVFVQPCFAATLRSQVKEGNALYKKEQFKDAAQLYKKALSDSPNSDIIHFNLGAASYKMNDYKSAVEHFQESLVSQDQAVEQKASYNLGNAKYRFGISKENTDLRAAIDLLKQSLRHYRRSLELDSKDSDAQYNYEFVEKELKRLEEKLQQQESHTQEEKEQSQQEKEGQEQQEGKSQPQPEGEKEGQAQDNEQENNRQDQQASDKEQPESAEEPEQQSQQEEQDAQEEDAGSSQGGQRKEEGGNSGAAQQPQGEMSEREASTLLDIYRDEEEPRGLYKGNIPVRGMPEAEKDW